MIFDLLTHAGRYAEPGTPLAAAFQYLVETDLSALPIGHIDIDGDRLYALVQAYTTKPAEQGRWEAHQAYIDVQYLVSGVERMGFAHISRLEAGEYDPWRDVVFLTGSGSAVDVFAGAFALFYPGDAHMPGLCVNAPESVLKVVIKVKVG
jgi:YhcH/YjgK/YiaL family protein